MRLRWQEVNNKFSGGVEKWLTGRYAKIKRASSTLTNGLVHEKCVKAAKGFVKFYQELSFYNQVELVKSFLKFGGHIECQWWKRMSNVSQNKNLLHKIFKIRRFALLTKTFVEIKGRIHQGCVWSERLYGSKTWWLREDEMAILRRTKRAMCLVTLIEKRGRQQLMHLLDLVETLQTSQSE